MLGWTREDAERALARALSRHVGYTTGAFHLDRIFSVVEYFRSETSAYVAEIAKAVELATDDAPLSPSYLQGVVDFASAFGLIERVSTREAKLVRYAATELGRSVLGVLNDEDANFRDHYLATVLMLADADFLVPLMLNANEPSTERLQETFARFTSELRIRRFEWLTQELAQPVLLERIAARITWLKRGKNVLLPYVVDQPRASTVRHHVGPRLGWLEKLGLLDRKAHALTPFGADMLAAVAEGSSYFWIAPNPDALAALALADPVGRATELDLGLVVADSRTPSQDEIDELVRDTVALMIRAFPHAKLIHADQASLRLPIAYVQYRAYRDERRYEWETVLASVFETERQRLTRYSAHKGQVGFYKAVLS